MPVQLSQVGEHNSEDKNVNIDIDFDENAQHQPGYDNNQLDDPLSDVHQDMIRWKNRRRMAWICLYAILFVTAAMIFYVPDARITKLEIVITWFYMSTATIICAYMGLATVANVMAKRMGK